MFKKENQQDLLDSIGSDTSSDYYRWTAASYLGDFGNKTTRNTVDALIGLLEDGNQNVRSNAADSLGNIARVNSLKKYVIQHALQPLAKGVTAISGLQRHEQLDFFKHGAAENGQSDNENKGHEYGIHRDTFLG